jgi:signal peptidase I
MGDDNIQSRPTTAAATGVTGGLPAEAPRPDTPAPTPSGWMRSALLFIGGLVGACLAVYLLLWWLVRLDGAPVVLRAVVVGLFGVSLAASAVFLWLACRLVSMRDAGPRQRPVSLARALGVALVLTVLGMGVATALLYLQTQPSAAGPVAGAAWGLAFYALLVLVNLRLLLRLSIARAFLVGVIWQGLSLVTALVLVYVLKFSLLEGFAIPSGGMAETLLGYHKQVPCPSCGHTFRVNAAAEAEQGQRVRTCVCPNCRLPITLHDPKLDGEYLVKGFSDTILDPGISGGDRILVGKGPLGGVPERLRPVVFRSPVDPRFTYVARLVGLPGETIAIYAGDLYVWPASRGLTFPPVEEGDDGPPGGPVRQKAMHVDAPEARDRWRKGEFQIIRKSPAQILAMRSLVYDADHPPSDLGLQGLRWSGDGWQGAGPDFRHAGAGLSWLRYRHLLRGQAQPSLITDFSAYNSGAQFAPVPERSVIDLILECEVEAARAEGELVLELWWGHYHRFRARFDLTTGACKLTRQDLEAGREMELASQPTTVRGAGKHRLRFANVDERLTVWVDDTLPFGDGVAHNVSKNQIGFAKVEYASIGATSDVTVRGLKLWRDVYYTQPGGPGAWSGPLTMYVQPGSFLVLGDNSAQSADSRSWGLVPERLVVGPVLLRYYPLDRAGRVE